MQPPAPLTRDRKTQTPPTLLGPALASLGPSQQRASKCQSPDRVLEICGGGFLSSFLPYYTTFSLTAAFLTQTVCLDDTTVKFEIWDTAGQERYHSLAPMYYRGAQAAIVVYDITNTVKISPYFSTLCSWMGCGQISSVIWGCLTRIFRAVTS